MSGQWLSFILSFLPVSIMAYFVPVIIRTVIDFQTAVFFGWVSIHLYIALAVGGACGFWAKRRAQNNLRTGMEKLIGEENFNTSHFRVILIKSIRFGIELTILLTMGCVFLASIILRVFNKVTWLDFAVILLICLGVVLMPIVWVILQKSLHSKQVRN